MSKPKKRNWIILLLILGALYLFSGVLANIVTMTGGPTESGNVAVIPITGAITANGQSFEKAPSDAITDRIKQAQQNNDIKAIILSINSPGGTAVASEEIADAVNDTNKTTVAWIREIGTSGAYWVASATDHIVASPVSTTGSIGVIGSYLEFADALENYNITYRRLIAGKYKDIGSPFKELTNEEKRKLQSKLNLTHQYFIDRVAANRNMTPGQVEQLANGMIYMGKEAKRNGLVDELGGEDTVHDYIETKHNITVDTIRYEKQPSLLSVLNQVGTNIGTAIGNGLTHTKGTSASDLKPYTTR